MRLDKLALEGDDGYTTIIETPRGSAYKYDYDPEKRAFALSFALPAGAVFPFDFGFIPSTLGSDGDPLDVLVLMEVPTFVGCVIEVRLVGVIEAKQGEGKKLVRNDRLIAVASMSHAHRDTRSLDDLGPILEDVTRFFVAYNAQKGQRFEPLGRRGAQRARKLVSAGHKRWRSRR